MSIFPPIKAHKTATPPSHVVESGPVSIGNGGIKSSLKTKAAGTISIPGPDKTVHAF